ncbi:MAG: hypothetical protein ABIQ12_06000 [Opitutaceae bacterium]
MKRTAVLCCSALTVFALAQIGVATAQPKAADSAKQAEAAKNAAPPTIEGVEVSRGALGYLGVQIVDSSFKISFYDAKKKPIKADVTRALLRWNPKYKSGSDRVVLNLSGDGKSLSAPRDIRPPYVFKLFITLLKDAADGDDTAGETYVIDFRA